MTPELLRANYKKLLPIVGNTFDEEPLYVSLAEDSKYYSLFVNATQMEFQKSLDKLMLSEGTSWSISGYLENRATILSEYPQMVTEERFYHLGIDINLPCATKLYAPNDGEVVLSRYESGKGNYGGMTVLKIQNGHTYYMLFGHLNPHKLPVLGKTLEKGEEFAQLGDMNHNGNWYCHTHLRISKNPLNCHPNLIRFSSTMLAIVINKFSRFWFYLYLKILALKVAIIPSAL